MCTQERHITGQIRLTGYHQIVLDVNFQLVPVTGTHSSGVLSSGVLGYQIVLDVRRQFVPVPENWVPEQPLMFVDKSYLLLVPVQYRIENWYWGTPLKFLRTGMAIRI